MEKLLLLDKLEKGNMESANDETIFEEDSFITDKFIYALHMVCDKNYKSGTCTLQPTAFSLR